MGNVEVDGKEAEVLRIFFNLNQEILKMRIPFLSSINLIFHDDTGKIYSMNEKQKEPLLRRFNSYGPINPKLHYFVPREKLIEQGYRQLLGESPGEGGHFITVWAPRQTGKSWIMLQVLEKIQNQKPARGDQGVDVDVVKVDLDLPDQDTNLDNIAASIAGEIFIELDKKNPGIDSLRKFPTVFTNEVLEKPLILVIDEFDALPKEGISRLTRVFRNLYMRRQKELNKPLNQRRYLLHGLALVGVRSVLGIENERGSPFKSNLSDGKGRMIKTRFLILCKKSFGNLSKKSEWSLKS